MCGISAQSPDCIISVASTTEPKSWFKFPSCTKVKNVHKELLQLCHHHQCQACTQVPCARDFWEIHQLRELPFPQSWYEHTETTELLSEYPCSRLYRFRELSPFSCQLNLVSSEALTPPPPPLPLCLWIVLAQSRVAQNVLSASR